MVLRREAIIGCLIIAAGLPSACGGKTAEPTGLDTSGDAGGSAADASGGGLDAAAGTAGYEPASCDGVISFADRELEAAVRDAIGMPTGDLRSEHVEALESFHAQDWDINDLSGIECLTGLENLSFANGSISDLGPLSALSSLAYLVLDAQQISDLGPLSEVTSLVYIYLGDNNISDLRPLAGLAGLTDLVLRDNQISDLGPLSGLPSLHNLWAARNSITDLSPLVANASLGPLEPDRFVEDYLRLVENPIDCSEQATNIQTLRDRGVILEIGWP